MQLNFLGMLQHLTISNYAIIQHLTIQFGKELNIITGETGAGKSILLGALGLLLGNRTDTSVLRNKQQKCVVEAEFALANDTDVNVLLEQWELDTLPNSVTLRREITANSKSRVFINDTPVTLAQLKTVAALLVDLHQQFDTLDLGNSSFQRNIVDAIAQNTATRASYNQVHKLWRQQQQQLAEQLEQRNQLQKEQDYYTFLFQELSDAAILPQEVELLEDEQKTLANAETITRQLATAEAILKTGDDNAVNAVKQAITALQQIAKLNTTAQTLVNRLQELHIELKDISDEVQYALTDVQINDERLAWVDNRLALLYKLQKKHGATTTDELLTIQQQLENKLQLGEQTDEQIAQLQKDIQKNYQQLLVIGETLHTQRSQVIAPFVSEINTLLKQVDMPNAKLQVQVQKGEPTEFGLDTIHFLLDANNTQKWEPLHKVASGGELSRLMLCIKSLVAKHSTIPTLIFDEIDTGISGEAAKKVGSLLRELSQNAQIICVTHQPQVAGKAHQHFYVYKQTVNNEIQTAIKLLSKEERIHQVAQMLSGNNPTQAALHNAQELMQLN